MDSLFGYEENYNLDSSTSSLNNGYFNERPDHKMAWSQAWSGLNQRMLGTGQVEKMNNSQPNNNQSTQKQRKSSSKWSREGTNEETVVLAPNASIFDTTALYHNELGAVNIKDIKGVYKNCRGIWAAQWTDAQGQRHTKYFNPKYFSTEESARVNAYKFKLDVTLQLERAKAGIAYRPDTDGSAFAMGPTMQMPISMREPGGFGAPDGSGDMRKPIGPPLTQSAYQDRFCVGAELNQMEDINSNIENNRNMHMNINMNMNMNTNMNANVNTNANAGQQAFQNNQATKVEPQPEEVIAVYHVLIAQTLGLCPCRDCLAELIPQGLGVEMSSRLLTFAMDARIYHMSSGSNKTSEQLDIDISHPAVELY